MHPDPGRLMRLVLCDDHRLFLDVLASALMAHGHDVVATTTTPDEAVRAVALWRPEACVLDLGFPQGSGVAAARILREQYPTTHILVLSATADHQLITDVLDAGVNGFVHKGESIDSVLRALEQMAHGLTAIDTATWARASRRSRPAQESRTALALEYLTEREREVLKLISQGLSTVQIAEALNVSKSTARTHVQNLLVKLGVHSRLQAAALVAASGFWQE